MASTTPPERWRDIERVLDGALDLPTGERAAFLTAACRADPELRGEVERLLRAHDRARDFLEDGLSLGGTALLSAATSWSDSAFVAPGATLANRYVLERELGRGGMATVYLARDLKHRRPVAVKILDPGLAHSV